MKRREMKRQVVLSAVLLPAMAFAQTAGGQKIERGLTQAASWLVGIGLLIGTLGLIYAVKWTPFFRPPA